MPCSVALRQVEIDSQNSQNEKTSTPATAASCQKNKRDGATFLEDLKDHIDEFINASMEEHKICFKKTMQKTFGMSKVVEERSSAAVEVALPLQTSASE